MCNFINFDQEPVSRTSDALDNHISFDTKLNQPFCLTDTIL